MQLLRFEWSESKNKANIQKHGIPFEEAKTVFADELGLLIADPDHSDHEDRFLLLGLSGKLRLLVISHTFDEQTGMVRIISSRKANRIEASKYRR